MRWSIIQLIWARELRDQLRDRRTVFMIAVLPLLLYPVGGYGVVHIAGSFFTQQTVVGVVGADNLRLDQPSSRPATVRSSVCWLAVHSPLPGTPLDGVTSLSTSVALYLGQPPLEYPPLLQTTGNRLAFRDRYVAHFPLLQRIELRRIDTTLPTAEDSAALQQAANDLLREQRGLDLLLVIPAGFEDRLCRDGKPALYVLSRPRDDRSRLANVRVTGILELWKSDLKAVRMARAGLPADFDTVVTINDPQRAKPVATQEGEGLFTVLMRIFPFFLVLWSLVGALYPAIDLCAGEKERGTMETLLISPAGREEIVLGKFLTIWVFSAATALLNLVSIAFTIWNFGSTVPGSAFRPMALFWGVALLLPLSAFFSAVCLAVGAYARSSKEGQYYLMPLFLLTMPLIFLTLAPGVELNAFWSMVPITGVALLLQKLMGEAHSSGIWLYFVPVLAPMLVYSWLALRWAIGQFQREEVLFREAERLDLGLWLKRLWRDKEMLPSPGEALFCFALILGLRWLSLGVGTQLPLLTRTGIAQLAFVAAPPLFMALILTTRPLLGLGFRLPQWWTIPAAALLALCAVPPLAELTQAVLESFPALKSLLQENHPLARELMARFMGGAGSSWQLIAVLGVLTPLCEELAFRGFVLSGLSRSFRSRTAILLSAFLFAVYQMNVFQLVPHFVLGLVLGIIAARSGSVLPAMVFHLVYNTLVLTSVLPGIEALAEQHVGSVAPEMMTALRVFMVAVCTLLAAGGIYVFWRLPRATNLSTGKIA